VSILTGMNTGSSESGHHDPSLGIRARILMAGVLRAERARADLTVDQLTSKSGISRSTVMMLLRGTREPRMPQLRALADALGVQPSYLVHEVERQLGAHIGNDAARWGEPPATRPIDPDQIGGTLNRLGLPPSDDEPTEGKDSA